MRKAVAALIMCAIMTSGLTSCTLPEMNYAEEVLEEVISLNTTPTSVG